MSFDDLLTIYHESPPALLLVVIWLMFSMRKELKLHRLVLRDLSNGKRKDAQDKLAGVQSEV